MVAHYGFMRKSDENRVKTSKLDIFKLYLTTRRLLFIIYLAIDY